MKKTIILTMLVAMVALPASSVMAAEITIQPGAEGKDTYSRGDTPDTNYGDSSGLKLMDYGISYRYRSFIQFDLSGIPAGQTIDSVTLSLYKYGHYGTVVVDATLYQITESWDESTLTYNDEPSYGSTAIASRSMTGGETNGWKTWEDTNLTSLVQDWYDGTTTNYGLVLRVQTNIGNSNIAFYSSDYTTDASLRPKLDVTYTPEPATMTLLLLGLPLALRRRRK
ncbi:MAG: DNRLRE domain-containing protein [Phycisphaerae bacterium]|nr:DNRLRE domain-containing protein [Phycisphaerae bacterium]